MNHFSKAIDDYYGRPLSDMAEDELCRQLRIQAGIAVLRSLLEAEEGNECLRTRLDYDELLGALKDATIPEDKLQDIVTDADDERFLCEKYDAEEYRYELRREESDL